GKCIRFSEKDVRPTGRGTQGVRAINLSKEDILVDMLIIDKEQDLFTLTSNGYGKRSSVEDYRLQNRGGKGIKAGVFNEKTGYLVNMKFVTDDNDIMIITTGGTIIRMHADSISRIGRTTRGVRVMNVKDSLVATVDVTERDDEAETQAPEETAADLSPEELAEGVVDEVEETDDTPVTDEAVDEGETDETETGDAPADGDEE
ncbi:MAG: DNA gyrase subunit A, partial [Clostridia bacterium]|nr:DNA gyrase subunit A [Clostridia bacterium]